MDEFPTRNGDETGDSDLSEDDTYAVRHIRRKSRFVRSIRRKNQFIMDEVEEDDENSNSCVTCASASGANCGCVNSENRELSDSESDYDENGLDRNCNLVR